MPPVLYDVFVVGPLEPGPVAEARLCETLARQSGRPVAVIAQALSGKNLRLAHGVARDVADTIARQMQTIGGLTTVTPHTPAGRPAPALTPFQGFAATSPGANATQPGLGPTAVPAPLGAPGGPPTAPPRFTLTPLGTTSGFPQPAAPAPLPLPVTPTVSMASTMPAPAQDYDPPSSISSFGMPETPMPAPNPFSVPDGAGDPSESALELSLAPVKKKKERKSHHTLAGASALNTEKIIATKSGSGLALADAEEGGYVERCPTHGLLFDRRKSRGCRKCLQARKSASQRNTPAGGLRTKPAKRAFAGLALALGLGFAPAAYFATGPGAAEVERLRSEQTELSQKPGTEVIVRRFDELDELVASRQWHVIGNTALIWLGVSGAVMVGFYKITA
jgi:hypothetical protein